MILIKRFSYIFPFFFFAYINQAKANNTESHIYYLRKIPTYENGALYNILNEPNYEGKFCVRKFYDFYFITVHHYKSKGNKDEKAYYELENIIKELGDIFYIKVLESQREYILKY